MSVLRRAGASLPEVAELLVVCAHPDDESFGLGGVLGAFVDRGTRVRVLCFTHGEASTLGEGVALGEHRAAELAVAASALGVQDARLYAYPDGRLAAVALEELVARVAEQAGDAELLVAFDVGGITAHPDHIRATEAALAFGTDRRLPVLGWALPEEVAAQLNAELGTKLRRAATRRARPHRRSGPSPAGNGDRLSRQPVQRQPRAVATPRAPRQHRAPPVAAPATEGSDGVSETDPSDPASARGHHSGPRTTRSWRAPAGRSASIAAPLGMLGLLAVQFLLGMALNLYVTIPPSAPAWPR